MLHIDTFSQHSYAFSPQKIGISKIIRYRFCLLVTRLKAAEAWLRGQRQVVVNDLADLEPKIAQINSQYKFKQKYQVQFYLDKWLLVNIKLK